MSLLFIPLFCESTVYSIPLRVYCLLHSYVSLLFIPHNVSLLFIPLLCSLLFIPLLCESTVYSTPMWVYCLSHIMWVYCLFHSFVGLLFIPLLSLLFIPLLSLLFIPLFCRSTVYSTPESTVYFTPLKVYCLFQSYVSLLFITFLLMLLCFVVPSKSFCQVVRKSGNVIPVSAANGQIITFCNISMNTTLQTSKHAESTSTTNNQQWPLQYIVGPIHTTADLFLQNGS